MIDLKCVRKRGLTQENLEKWLAIDPLNVPHGDPFDPDPDRAAYAKRGRLIHRIRSRVQEGMDRNLMDYKTYYALDTAWETPFRQISPTIIQQFVNSDPNEASVYKAFQDWGLTNMIREETDPKTGVTKKVLNLPVFFNIFVPLVRAYVTIRWAKIMNDRRQTPFFKYEPAEQTAITNLKCKALTDRIQVMATQYGYYDVMKQAVLKMLHYSNCFQFTKEEWHYEDTYKLADEVDVSMGATKEDGKVASVGEEIRVTEREGLTYHLPHPTRTFYDLAYGAYTFNYDYGAQYAGYWRIARYREIEGNPRFWNKDKVALGTTDLIHSNQLFFTSVYAGCQLKSMGCLPVRPPTPSGSALAAEVGLGAGHNDRENQLTNLYYGTEHGDQGVLVTEYWERLVPSDNGLGEYDCPIWMRFLLAGDGCTILYAAPVPYCPVIYYGYDADESRSKNPSLSLEILPFQDHFSNMLTQILLTCKQNLANLTFIDEDQLMTGDPNQVQGARDTIDRIRNMGEGYFRFLNIFGYSSKRAMRMQAPNNRGVPDVVQSFQFPRGNVAEMSNVLRTILEILERVLVMSSQEIAQAASHELRVDEVRNIQQSTSSRLMHTAVPVDIATQAWMRQLYIGDMQYGDPYFFAKLPSDIPLTKEQLEKFGFTQPAYAKSAEVAKDRYRTYKVDRKQSMTAIDMWSFVASRDNTERQDGVKFAQTMSLVIQAFLGNPITAAAIGPDQALDWANEISRLMGFSKDLKFKNASPQVSDDQRKQEAQAQLQQVVQQVLEAVDQKTAESIKPIIEATAENSQQIKMLSKGLDMTVEQLNLLVKNLQLNPANDTFGTQNNGGGGSAAGSRMAPVLPGAPV